MRNIPVEDVSMNLKIFRLSDQWVTVRNIPVEDVSMNLKIFRLSDQWVTVRNIPVEDVSIMVMFYKSQILDSDYDVYYPTKSLVSEIFIVKKYFVKYW